MRKPFLSRAVKPCRRLALIAAVLVLISSCTSFPAKSVLPNESILIENRHSVKLIVFIHDLNGGPIDTWSDPQNQPAFFWPERFAQEKGFHNADVLSFAYQGDCGPGFSIQQTAQQLAEEINTLLPSHDHYQSLSIVAQGVGGLIAREFVLGHPENLDRRVLLDKVVLLGTPNLGSGYKNVAAHHCPGNSGALQAASREKLDPLNQRWREQFLKPKSGRTVDIYAGYELVPSGPMGTVVGKESAKLFSRQSQPFIKNHAHLSQPHGSADPVYLWVRQILLKKPRDPRVQRFADPEVIRMEEVILRMRDELKGSELEPVLGMVDRGALDQAHAAVSAAERKGTGTDPALIEFTRARIYELSLDYRNALLFYEKAVQLEPNNSAYLNDTGVVHLIQGNYDTARDYFERALESDLKLVGSDHPNVAVHWSNLGDLWRKQGDYDKATAYYDKSLNSFLKTIGPEHPFVARIWNHKGTAHYNNGEYDLAVANWEKSLNSEMRIYDGNHPTIAKRWNDLGEAWRKKGEYDKAIRLHQKALESNLKTYGEDHPVVARNWNYLGEAWRKKGEYDKAIQYHERALLTDMKALGPAHENVAHDWTNLGTAWRRQGDQEKAIAYYDKALDSFNNIYGKGHPNVAILWNNLGSAWKAKGEEERALDYYEKALASNLKSLGPNHPTVAHDWNNLASMWHDKGDYDKAMEYYQNALTIFKKSNLPHKVAVVETNIERTLKKKGMARTSAN